MENVDQNSYFYITWTKNFQPILIDPYTLKMWIQIIQYFVIIKNSFIKM